ncbi:hypothetical protein LR48_Vigan08g039300 [Vigna angularis]|uniref:Uncharacterized protein n=1 Tax=Phaseolus angularis TaxID=3914 RepID=A0A0L9V3N0_PHAAN|nr:hypothetical protein LR48_Vigan08g039300 [Vigna angularis]
MASSSHPSTNRGKAVVAARNVYLFGWISDEETRLEVLRWTKFKHIVPHKYLNLDLFEKGVDVSGEKKCSCNFSNVINRNTLTSIGLMKTTKGWCFKDEENMVQTSGSTPALNEDRSNFVPETNFERFVVEKTQETQTEDRRSA